MSERECVAIFYGYGAFAESHAVKEVVEHRYRLGGGYHFHFRVLLKHCTYAPGMVRLHVLDYQVGGVPSVESGVEKGEPFAAPAYVDCIYHSDIFIINKIGII